MRAVVQRIIKGQVTVDDKVVGAVSRGMLIYLGIANYDSNKDVEYMVGKVTNLRIFEDSEGKMNLSLLDVAGELLVISQFTLMGDCRKGRRPNFMDAAKPEVASELYAKFVDGCRDLGIKVETGIFQAHMHVESTNDGPVTMIIDSKKKF
ncbi:MAG: D-tyrosyl-tRNA(Tyr) deacylase [Alkaliphilus sp.]|nr:D-tyrosyl-tRNA(Tyr) deacylase [bacterium AH-315-E09]PHS36234.1 MAG: D-tyrosyl-tRNA(Tyr) deacylase [Alkaliphilus sp.]